MEKSSTDGVFKNELTRATGSIIDYLNSDEDTTTSEMIEKLQDLREYIDDSIIQTGYFSNCTLKKCHLLKSIFRTRNHWRISIAHECPNGS